MAPMPRPRKPYVHRETTRHGKAVWYFRRGEGKRTRLHGEYESPEWLRDYNAALGAEQGDEPPKRMIAGTLGWLIDRYMDSVAFVTMAPGTQKGKRGILNRVKARAGDKPLSHITPKRIAEGRDARSATPAAASNYVRTVRAMFAWAVKAELMATNPAAGVDSRAPKTDGHHTWTLDEVRQFWAAHPIGTMPRLAMDIMLFTGMRRSDAVLFGRQHVRDGWARYRSAKTSVDVVLPLLPPLARSIEATPTKGLTFLTTQRGMPFQSAASFGNWFRDQCVAAGVPGRAHGLRKAGATIAAENGASDQQLMAMFGWTDAKQAGVYTRRAQRAVLAGQAGRLLIVDEDATSIPAPAGAGPRTLKRE